MASMAERTVDGAVSFLVAGFEIGAAVIDELPQRRGTGTARAIA
jgi:hypothetical protein